MLRLLLISLALLCGPAWALSPELAARIDQIVMEVHEVPGKSLETLHANLRARNFSVSRYTSGWVAINQTARAN